MVVAAPGLALVGRQLGRWPPVVLSNRSWTCPWKCRPHPNGNMECSAEFMMACWLLCRDCLFGASQHVAAPPAPAQAATHQVAQVMAATRLVPRAHVRSYRDKHLDTSRHCLFPLLHHFIHFHPFLPASW